MNFQGNTFVKVGRGRPRLKILEYCNVQKLCNAATGNTLIIIIIIIILIINTNNI